MCWIMGRSSVKKGKFEYESGANGVNAYDRELDTEIRKRKSGEVERRKETFILDSR